MQAGTLTRDDRSILERSSHSRLPDQLLRWVLTGLAGFILVLIAFFFLVNMFANAGEGSTEIWFQWPSLVVGFVMALRRAWTR